MFGDAMNIEKANCIPMSEILKKLNCTPIKSNENDSWHLSPLTGGKLPSFHVNKKENTWDDFNTGQKGNIIAFVSAYLKSCKEADTIVDVLRWLKNMMGNSSLIAKSDSTQPQDKLVLNGVEKITHFGLNNYINSRGINLTVGHTYLKEVKVLNKTTLQNIVALGLKNEENGYEISNAMFEGCVGKQGITFIRGNKPKPKAINLFHNKFDFMSVVTMLNGKPIENDSIILHSTDLIDRAYPYIKGYGYQVLYSWMNNDEAGNSTTKLISDICKSEDNLIHKPMQQLYSGYTSVNAHHVRNTDYANKYRRS